MTPAVLTQAYVPASTEQDLISTTVGALLFTQARDHADADALIEWREDGEVGRRWTYADLAQEATEIARGLAATYAPGDRIVLWAQNCPEWVLMEYAAALAGLTLVTANPSFQAEELRYVIKQSDAVALIFGDAARGTPLAPIASAAAAGLLDSSAVRPLLDVCANRNSEGTLPNVDPNDPAQIQYTSGTTGFPKGALLPHQGLINNARFSAHISGVGPTSIYLCPVPMFHTGGCAAATLGCLQAGACMVLMAVFDPVQSGQAIEMLEATHFLGVPIMVSLLLEVQPKTGFDPSSLERVISGGAMVAPALARGVTEKLNCPLTVIYGQTEYCPLITMNRASDTLEDVCGTVGQALPHTEVAIMRPADNSIADIGEVGEICARGPTTMLRYNNDPKATAEAIDSEGWLHTGDLGSMDTRGYVAVTGRLKEMIIRGGENLFPAEIENVLLEHPDVSNVAVVGLPDEKWGEIVAAFVTPAEEAVCDPDVLRAYCRERLSPQKTPIVWRRAETLPLTGPGKIQKFKLVETQGDYPDLTPL